MTLPEIEKTKLFANALDRVSTACFTVGLLTPLAGYIYNVGDFRSRIGVAALVLGLAGWIVAGIALHFWARRILNRLEP